MTDDQRSQAEELADDELDLDALEAEDGVVRKAPSCAALNSKGPAVGTRERSRAKKEITTEQLAQLLHFDRQALAGNWKNKVEVVIGTDEVGRGCLAGPVMACAVVLPEIDPSSELGWQLARLNDSKQVNPNVRAELATILRGVCQFAIGEASVAEIDEINILHASLLAMKRAVRRLKLVAPAVILVDGNKKITSVRNIEQMTVIDGDTKSASIAAASIIAKVHRDAFMTKLARKFPHYAWESNKGYRSRDHWEALNKHGMCEWHRRTFVDHWLTEGKPED